jgi:hypothetical protein
MTIVVVPFPMFWNALGSFRAKRCEIHALELDAAIDSSIVLFSLIGFGRLVVLI